MVCYHEVMDKIYDIIEHTLVFSIADTKFEIDVRHLIWPLFLFALFYYLLWRKTGFKDLSSDIRFTRQSPDEVNSDDQPYEHVPVNIPSIPGWLTRIYRRLFRSKVGRYFFIDEAKRLGKINAFLQRNVPEGPTFYPVVYPSSDDLKVNSDFKLEDYIKPSDEDGFHFNTISDYYTAYKNHSVTPLDVATRVIAAIKETVERQPSMNIIVEFHEDEILKSAEASTLRWKENKPLSVFDGITVAVKDQISLAGHSIRSGTPIKKLGCKIDLSQEGIMVSKLRAGGAIFIGITNMHQFGAGITNINSSLLHGTARNPYNDKYPPGGSSGGSGAAVAAGLCPIALGIDGGGSIRIPSAVCGMVGIKASYARIGLSDMHEATSTVAHSGPICSTTRDTLIAYGFLAGIDPKDLVGHCQPPVDIDKFEKMDLTGIRIGIDWAFFNDSDTEIQENCKKAVDYLVTKRNAQVIDISIPEIQDTQRAHVVTILMELYALCKEYYHEDHDDLDVDVEVSLAIGETISGSDYFQAQQQRTRYMNILKRLFRDVDCIITPAVGAFMPELTNDILRNGFMDLSHSANTIRFCNIGNFAGNPSMSVPVGYSAKTGLPIGLLIQTAWWKENLLLQIANSLNGHCCRKKPQVYFDILKIL